MTNRVLLDEGGIITAAADAPDHENGNACHRYTVTTEDGDLLLEVAFQHGPIGDSGVNGVQHRQLLAIVEDRLRSFQLGRFSSILNELTLGGVQTALAMDAERTKRRSLAGTEGFNIP